MTSPAEPEGPQDDLAERVWEGFDALQSYETQEIESMRGIGPHDDWLKRQDVGAMLRAALRSASRTSTPPRPATQKHTAQCIEIAMLLGAAGFPEDMPIQDAVRQLVARPIPEAASDGREGPLDELVALTAIWACRDCGYLHDCGRESSFVSDGRLGLEVIAELIEIEERACRQKEHDGKSHHARSIWGASAATCGVLAAQVRSMAPNPFTAALSEPERTPTPEFEAVLDALADSELQVCPTHIDAEFVCPECFKAELAEGERTPTPPEPIKD